MPADYLEKVLRPYMENLNNTEKKIASYFIDSNQSIVNKTISELSQEIGFSESTIFKFVKKIGFQGFQDFKITLATNYKDNNEEVTKTNIFTDITENDSVRDIFQKVIIPKVNLLDYLLETLSEELVEEAVDMIHHSDTLFFSGVGGSSVIAYDSFHKFLRTQFQCQFISDFNLQLTYSKKVEDNSLAFLFSHSGVTKEVIELATSLKKHGTKIISLTGNYGTPLEELSDIAFVISSEESTLRSQTLSSRILYMTIIDILYVIIMYRDNKPAEFMDLNQD